MTYITEGRGTTQTINKTMKQYTEPRKYHKHSSAWALWRWSPRHG